MSWTPNLRRRRARSWRERARLIEAMMWLGMMRVALDRRPFRRLIARWGLAQNADRQRPQAEDIAKATGITWAVKTAASRTPWPSTCFVQALAGMMMLRRRHIVGSLYLGVAKDAGTAERFAAHAWLACGDVVLIGDSGRVRFTVISSFSPSFERDGRLRSRRSSSSRSRGPADGLG